MEPSPELDRRAVAQREAGRHVAMYLLQPSDIRRPLTLAAPLPSEMKLDRARVDACLVREAAAVRALAQALLERGTLASAEADLIVDVARGDATVDDLRDYRVLTRQSRCGLG